MDVSQFSLDWAATTNFAAACDALAAGRTSRAEFRSVVDCLDLAWDIANQLEDAALLATVQQKDSPLRQLYDYAWGERSNAPDIGNAFKSLVETVEGHVLHL